jgi:hypothetical protein
MTRLWAVRSAVRFSRKTWASSLLQKVQVGPSARPPSLVSFRGSFPGSKVAGEWRFPLTLFIAETKNEWSNTATPPTRLHGVHIANLVSKVCLVLNMAMIIVPRAPRASLRLFFMTDKWRCLLGGQNRKSNGMLANLRSLKAVYISSLHRLAVLLSSDVSNSSHRSITLHGASTFYGAVYVSCTETGVHEGILSKRKLNHRYRNT